MQILTKHISTLFNLSEENAGIFLSQFSGTELKKNEVLEALEYPPHHVALRPDRLVKTGD